MNVDELRGGLCLGFLCGFATLVFPLLFVVLTTPWLKCYMASGRVSVLEILGMRIRRSPIEYLVDTHLALIHSGYEVTIKQVESAYLANRHRIVHANDLFEIVKAGLPKADSPHAWDQNAPTKEIKPDVGP